MGWSLWHRLKQLRHKLNTWTQVNSPLLTEHECTFRCVQTAPLNAAPCHLIGPAVGVASQVNPVNNMANNEVNQSATRKDLLISICLFCPTPRGVRSVTIGRLRM